MLESYLITAIRHFSRNRLHAAINILGLGLGLAVSLLAFVFLLDEQSFDQFHSKKDRLYRLNKVRTDERGATALNAESSGLYGPGMKDEFPEVENYARYQPWFNSVVLSYDDTHIELTGGESVFTDNSFLEIFDFSLLRGDRKNALTRPSTIVLTPAIASRLFGADDPIGKKIIGMNQVEFEVTGIVSEAPRSSHIQYKALISFATTTPQLGPLNFEWMNNWNTQTMTTYVLLRPGGDPEDVKQKLKTFTATHIPTRVNDYAFYLQPFRELYMSANLVGYHHMAKMGSRQYVNFFELIALFILLIACVNYINISTSAATKRSREVGMRKSLGASKKQLLSQFLGESLVTTMMAGLLAIALMYFVMPLFNQLTGKALSYELLFDFKVISVLVGLMLFVTFLAGLYPAFILAAFKPSESLKASSSPQASRAWPRYALITFQLVIAVVMIATTLVISRQLRYILDRDLGFDKENVLVVTLTNEMVPHGETIQQQTDAHSSVVSTSLSRMALGGGSYSSFIQPEGFPPDQIETRMLPVDFNFENTYGLEMAQGRFFDNQIAGDSNAVVINEALVAKLGWEDPLHKIIRFEEGGDIFPVVGVVKDFNYHSLYQKIEPIVMFVSARNRRNLSIRFSGNPSELLGFLESTWKKFEQRYPFQYYFVDQQMAQSYQSDQRLFKTVITFSALSIIIACLGLYGLVSFTIAQRTKEFGIRKILGATVLGLNFMVNQKFIVLASVAGLVASPVVLFASKEWLASYAYQIESGPVEIVIATLITLGVTLLAVSFQAVRAANINPARALRCE